MTPHTSSRRARRSAFMVYVAAAVAACSPAPTPTEPSESAPESRGAPAEAVASAVGRPNIVVIMSDDQTTHDMRVMGQTRNLIGAAGVTFPNNIVTYALCCPSRATFLTGQYPHNHGVRSNSLPEGGHTRLDHTNTLPVWLQATGYVTGHIGKYLNGYGEVDTLEVPPGYTEWYASIGQSAYSYYGYLMNENGTLVSYGSAAEHYQADVYTAKAVDFIRRRGRAAATGGSPFFLFVTYLAPHWGDPVEPGDPTLRTAVPAPRHKGRFAGQMLPKSPAFNEADMSDKPLTMRNRPVLTPTEVDELQEAYRQRLESLLAVDQGVARIINVLRNIGILENTVVVYTSDNGWYQGEHRIGFGKVWPYEAAVKVPLLIRGPGVTPGRTVTAPVANIDLAPTILEVAGGVPRRVMDGRSLVPMLQGQANWPTGSGARHLLVERNQQGGAANLFWSIRRGKYVYTEYGNGDRELYDLGVDSAQLASRHADPAYEQVRRGLAIRLARMKTCTGTACW